MPLELPQRRSCHFDAVEPIMRVKLNSNCHDEGVAALKDTSEMVSVHVSRVKANPISQAHG
jgi:hypothetical protein